MNIDQLFGMFSQGDSEVFKENGVEEVLDNSYILIGMVVKGVENYYIIDQIHLNRFGESYLSVREKIRLKYFLGLLEHLERVDGLPLDTVIELRDEFGEQAILYAFQEMIDCFLAIEYYEKCAIIQKYIELFSTQKLECIE
jgi:hypothetical protein